MVRPSRKRTRAEASGKSDGTPQSQNGPASTEASGSPKAKRSRISVAGPKRGRVDNRRRIPQEKLVSFAMSQLGLSFKIDTADMPESLRNKIVEKRIELPVVVMPTLRPDIADYYIETAFRAKQTPSTGMCVCALIK